MRMWKRYVSVVTVSTECTTTTRLRASPVSITEVDLCSAGTRFTVTRALGSAVCNVTSSCDRPHTRRLQVRLHPTSGAIQRWESKTHVPTGRRRRER
jgi:hypothetical protein